MKYQRNPNQPTDVGDINFARIFFPDGRVMCYSNSVHAVAIFFALKKGIRAAFRTRGDSRPVYAHDFVDKQ